MTRTGQGWVLFLAASGTMLGLLAIDIAKLTDWGQLYTPSFVANILGHFGTVIAAFVGGRIIPTSKE